VGEFGGSGADGRRRTSSSNRAGGTLPLTLPLSLASIALVRAVAGVVADVVAVAIVLT
jgi:hypothetical protein